MYIKTFLLKIRFVSIIFTFLILIMANFTTAQERAYVGAKYGYGFSRYYFTTDRGLLDGMVEQEFVPINQYGVVFNHINEKNWGFQLEVLMTQKAWKEKIIDNVGNQDVYMTSKTDYIEIPILSQYRLGNKNVGLVVNGGIYAAFQLNFEIEKEGTIDSTRHLRYMLGDSVITFINYDNIGNNSFDYGFKGGLAFDLNVNIFNFQLQIMYTQSVQNFLDPKREEIYRSLHQGLMANVILKVRLFNRE